MRKAFMIFAAMLSMVAVSCKKDNGSSQDDPTPAEDEITAYAEVVNGKATNKLIFENHMTGVSGYFDYSYGTTTYGSAKEEAVVVVTGDIPVKFIGSNTTTFEKVEKDFTVTVEELYYDIPEAWALLCGKGSKTWTWDEEASENGPWGEAGFRTEYEPWDDFWGDYEYYGTEEGGFWGKGATITFSLNGGTKFNRTNSAKSVSEDGTFSLDLTQQLYNVYNDEGLEDWPLWSIGKLHINDITLPLADNITNYATDEAQPFYDFYIVELTEDTLKLACYIGADSIDDLLEEHPDPDEWAWDETWMWLLKAAE